MSILSFLGSVITPVTNLISEFVEDKDKANELRAKLFEIQTEAANKALAYDEELLKAKASIIQAEATGQSWMQRNWRPITMLTFLVLVVCDSFGLLTFRLSNEAWTLLQIGLGGYVVGRSAEKVLPKVTEVLKRG